MPLNLGLEKDVEYNIVELQEIHLESHGYTCILQNIMDTSNSHTRENE